MCLSHRLDGEIRWGRRPTLDSILVDAAISASAQVRTATRVVDVLRIGLRVSGVVTRIPAGELAELRAQLVVCADGQRSTVAGLVRAR